MPVRFRMPPLLAHCALVKARYLENCGAPVSSVDIETPKYPGCYPRLGEIVIRRLQNINSKSKASMSESHLHAVKSLKK